LGRGGVLLHFEWLLRGLFLDQDFELFVRVACFVLIHSRSGWLVGIMDSGIGYELPWRRLSCFLGVIPEPRLDFLSLGNFRLGLTRIELGLNLDLSSIDRTFVLLLLLGPAHHETGKGLILHEEVILG
jgi:hypothetical protein